MQWGCSSLPSNNVMYDRVRYVTLTQIIPTVSNVVQQQVPFLSKLNRNVNIQTNHNKDVNYIVYIVCHVILISRMCGYSSTVVQIVPFLR